MYSWIKFCLLQFVLFLTNWLTVFINKHLVLFDFIQVKNEQVLRFYHDQAPSWRRIYRSITVTSPAQVYCHQRWSNCGNWFYLVKKKLQIKCICTVAKLEMNLINSFGWLPNQMLCVCAAIANFNETIYLCTSEIKTITFRTSTNFIIAYALLQSFCFDLKRYCIAGNTIPKLSSASKDLFEN